MKPLSLISVLVLISIFLSSCGQNTSPISPINTGDNIETEWVKTFYNGENCTAKSVQQTRDGGFIVAGNLSRSIFLLKLNVDGNQQWYQTLEGSGSNTNSVEDVHQTKDGGFILTGATQSNSSPPWKDNYWLLKTDANGNKEWEKIFGENSFDFAAAVQQTADGGYIIIGTTYPVESNFSNSDFWLIKTNSSGEKEWDKIFDNTSGDWARSVQQTSDGGYIICGSIKSSETYSSWLIKTDSTGNKVWDKIFDNTSGDWARSVQQTSDGGYIVCGSIKSSETYSSWLIKTDSTGNKVWDKIFDNCNMLARQTADAGYILAGTSGPNNSYDFKIIKTDSGGNKYLERKYDFGASEQLLSAQQTIDGGYILAGLQHIPSKDINCLLVKTDFCGNIEWSKTYDGPNEQIAYSIQQTADNGYILAGMSVILRHAESLLIKYKPKQLAK